MDEMELIQWITRLKEEVKALKETITVLEDVNDDLRWEIERLQQLIDNLPVEIVPREATDELLSNPRNAAALQRSIQQANDGQTEEHELHRDD